VITQSARDRNRMSPLSRTKIGPPTASRPCRSAVEDRPGLRRDLTMDHRLLMDRRAEAWAIGDNRRDAPGFPLRNAGGPRAHNVGPSADHSPTSPFRPGRCGSACCSAYRAAGSMIFPRSIHHQRTLRARVFPGPEFFDDFRKPGRRRDRPPYPR